MAQSTNDSQQPRHQQKDGKGMEQFLFTLSTDKQEKTPGPMPAEGQKAQQHRTLKPQCQTFLNRRLWKGREQPTSLLTCSFQLVIFQAASIHLRDLLFYLQLRQLPSTEELEAQDLYNCQCTKRPHHSYEESPSNNQASQQQCRDRCCLTPHGLTQTTAVWVKNKFYVNFLMIIQTFVPLQ